MAKQTLSELVVEFSLEGHDKLDAALKSIYNRTAEAKDALDKHSKSVIQSVALLKGLTEVQAANLLKTELNRQKLKELTEQLTKFGVAAVENVKGKAVTAWALLTGTTSGFALAGLRASAMGELFSFKLEILSRVIGGLVAPEFYKFLGLLDRFTDYLRQLDPAQKETVARWLEMSAVGLTLTRLFGGWVGLLGGVVTGMGAGSATAGKFAELGQRLLVVLDKLMPALETIADVLAGTLNVALDALNGLLGEGALKWVAAAGAALLFASLAARLVGALAAITSALRVMTAAKITALAFSGPTGWAQLAAGAAIVGVSIYGAVKAFNAFGDGAARATKEHKGLRDELARRVSGEESFFQTIARIQQAAFGAGPAGGGGGGRGIVDVAQGIAGSMFNMPWGKGGGGGDEAIDWLKKIATTTSTVAYGIDKLLPAFGK